MMRPDRDTWLLGIAEAVAMMGDCTRRQVGAVIASPDWRLVCGYNGVPAGQRGCLDGGCPRGRHYKAYSGHADDQGIIDFCACHLKHPCPDYIEPGSFYDFGPGACLAIHAEINALLRSSWQHNQGAAMYVTREPCQGCLKIIAGSGIIRVVYPGNSLDYPFLEY